ncbi:MAG: glycosyltransferase family 39 protein [Chloroflexi bacterium]|nr:glycosyltransferase family 39 protein [Chloroflexota bacterium]
MEGWERAWRRLADSRRDEWLLPALLVTLALAAFGLRVYQLEFQSFWRDEVDAVLFAREGLRSLVSRFIAVGENGPLYSLILHYWLVLAGSSEFAVRFLSVAFGVVAIPLTYAAGALVLGRWTGLAAAAVATLSPYYIWYSQEAKMYSLLAALTLLSAYLFLKAMQSNGPWFWILYVTSTSVALYVHFFAALVLVGEAAVFFAGISRFRNRLGGFLAAAVWLTVPYVPLAVWQWPLLLNPPPSPYAVLPLREMATALLSAFSVGASGGNALTLTLFIFLLCCAVVLGRGEAQPPSRWPVIGALLYLVAPLVAFYAVSLRYPMFTERYLIVVAPGFQILVAAGLIAIGRRSAVLLVACATLVAVVSWMAAYHLQHTTIKADFRAAVRYYEAEGQRNDAVVAVMPYMRRSFDYYHRSPYRWVDPPYANQGVSEEEVSNKLKAATGGIKRLWLFIAEEDFWDDRALVRGWLDRNGRLLDEREFVGVRLRYYELSEE